MIRNIALVIVIAIAGLLALATTRPSEFGVSRSLDMKAPPDRVHPLIDDFHAWSAWSPYEKLDPGMKRTFEGAPRGKGAAYAWSGDGKAGAGRMEIVDSAAQQVDIQLDFTKPIEGHNLARFTLVPNGDTTRVTWGMTGPSPYIAKLMGIFLDMDKMIGADFETGLRNLKAIAEKNG